MRCLGRSLLYLFACLGFFCAAALCLGLYFRRPLLEWALARSLAGSSVELRSVEVKELGLAKAELSGFAMAWQGQEVRVESIILQRPAALSLSLGRLELKGVSLSVDATRLSSFLAAPKSAAMENAAAKDTHLPSFDAIRAQGSLRVGTSKESKTLGFALGLEPSGQPGGLKGGLDLSGDLAAGHVGLLYDGRSGDFSLHVEPLEMQLAALRSFLLPYDRGLLGDWDFDGRLRFVGGVSQTKGVTRMQGGVEVREASVRSPSKGLEAEGVRLDLAFSDLAALQSAKGQVLTANKAKVGPLSLGSVAMRFELCGADLVRVEALNLEVLGGRLDVEPFVYVPSVGDLGATLRFTKLDVERVLELFPVARTQAKGRADGVVPIKYTAKGFEFGRGWLAMSADTEATLRLDQPGLLTSGLSTTSMAYPTLKAVEDGILNLRVKEMRAELFGPDMPDGRSAVLHVSGEPTDPMVKAPVSLDVNVNGPLAALINWSLDSRVGIRSGK